MVEPRQDESKLEGDFALEIYDVHVSEIDRYPDGIRQLLVRDFDALILRGAFPPAEVATILDGFAKLPPEARIDTGVTLSYPKPFGSVAFELRSRDEADRRATLERYFADCLADRNAAEKALGVDIEKRVIELFSRMSGGRSVDIPSGFNGLGSYPGVTTRSYLSERPMKGTIPLHCGNFFQEAFAPFYVHLSRTVRVKNQLSFLIMLDPPTRGGELTLFDFIWQEGQTMDGFGDNRHVKLPDQSLADLEDENIARSVLLTPRAGDMIIFAGGPIWHRVEALAPGGRRVTAGGFVGLAHDDSTVYLWA